LHHCLTSTSAEQHNFDFFCKILPQCAYLLVCPASIRVLLGGKGSNHAAGSSKISAPPWRSVCAPGTVTIAGQAVFWKETQPMSFSSVRDFLPGNGKH
jgi:hypothetical protein